ncbi:MAG TPA: hypothetical protein VFV67_26645 [Actinophytocola sp.]|uniref:hypothetical protein n=1 Tax=Actinophytocola sp. TaxID=1872138 RepID=UPI002DB80239|nr:hypothetical protein [Actinophytocola sp.]HEU5474242.1 hypothetical protein [Actinophytocola sp.]
MHSLISAPTIGFDLTRMDGGAATAELLADLLPVRTAEWAELADRLPRESVTRATARVRALSLADQRPTVRDLAGVDPTSAVTLLQHAPIGTLTALLDCVRTDVLVPDRDDPDAAGGTPAPPVVVAMATDAVSATYLRELLSHRERRALAAGWLAGRRLLPERRADLGPQQDAVRTLLGLVRTLSPAAIRALSEAADAMRAGSGDWAAAMHSMTWAVHVSGRIRSAAAAQFRLVQAIDLGGVPVADRAAGVWNVLSGAVQALIVRDLADAEAVHQLLDPLIRLSGISMRSLRFGE